MREGRIEMGDTPFMVKLKGALEAEDLAPNTVELTARQARQFEEWYAETVGHGIDPDDVQVVAVDLQDYRGHLQRKGTTPGSVQRHFASIRKALLLIAPEVAVKLRWPKLPTQAPSSPSGFTRSERNAIIRAAEQLAQSSPRDACVIHILLNVGCRASSLANLRLDDVVIRERSGSVTFRHAKGDRTYEVPLNAEARAAITRYLKVRPPVTDHPNLLCSERFPYPPVSRAVIWRIWHERLRKHLPAKVAEKIRGPHQARHDLARRLLSGDGGRTTPTPIQDVARILGHAGGDPRIVCGVYGSPSEEDLKRALDRIVGEEDGEG